MTKFLVVVADSARARVFERAKKFSPLVEFTDLAHPESRLKRQDLASDRPGTVHESRTPGESQASEPTDPKEHEAQVFAREIAEFLKQARTENGLAGITLVAAPHFLGLIRQSLDAATAGLLIAGISANLTRESPEKIQERIDQK